MRVARVLSPMEPPQLPCGPAQEPSLAACLGSDGYHNVPCLAFRGGGVPGLSTTEDLGPLMSSRPPQSEVRPQRESSAMRVLELLMLVLDASGSVGVTEAAAATGLHKATVSRILATLATREYVTKDPISGRYLAGPAIVRRLRKPIVEDVLCARGQPILARLRDLSGETASLHVVAWPDRVFVGEVPSLHGLRRAHAPGETWPLTTGATGMAFLSASSDDVVEQALIARAIPEAARAGFQRRLATARQMRVAISELPDHISGMVGMSSPIVGPSGQVIAMVTLSGPAGRLTPRRMQELVPYLTGAADELRAIIGA